jgi:YD repeat-containing protein
MDSGTGRLNLTTNVTYDAVGNVQTIQDPNGNTTTLTFDSNRRLTQKMDPAPFSYLTKQTFDTNNNLLTIQSQTGNVSNPWQITT